MTHVNKMFEKENKQNLTSRRSSFTEKTKRRLEIYRHRSLQQTNDDDGRLSNSTFWFCIIMKVRSSTSSMRDNDFVQIQIIYNIKKSHLFHYLYIKSRTDTRPHLSYV